MVDGSKLSGKYVETRYCGIVSPGSGFQPGRLPAFTITTNGQTGILQAILEILVPGSAGSARVPSTILAGLHFRTAWGKNNLLTANADSLSKALNARERSLDCPGGAGRRQGSVRCAGARSQWKYLPSGLSHDGQ